MLREYQILAQNEIRDSFNQGKKRVILCMPTGSGKTFTFCDIIRLAISRNKFCKCLILTDRKELLKQSGSTLEVLGIEAEYIHAKEKNINQFKQVYVGMVETVNNRIKSLEWLINDLSIIIIDEAHKGNFRKVIPYLKNKFIIGATATPISASKKFPLKDFFNDIVIPIQISELIEHGSLLPARTYTDKIDLSSLKKSSTGDYTEKSQNDFFGKHERREGLIKEYKQKAEGLKTMVFCSSVKQSKESCEDFVQEGYPCKHLDGKTSVYDRAGIILWFKNTKGAILCNVDVATTGFDEPSVEAIIINLATTSLTKWLQMCGRGGRTFGNLKEFVIIDMGNNIFGGGHGLWENDRNWSDFFFNPPEWKENKEEGVTPIKMCENCGYIMAVSTKKCPSCGAIALKEKYFQQAQLQEVDRSIIIRQLPPHLDKPIEQYTVSELIERKEIGSLQTGQPYKHAWLIRKIKERGEKSLRLYASMKGYKSGWVERQLSY